MIYLEIHLTRWFLAPNKRKEYPITIEGKQYIPRIYSFLCFSLVKRDEYHRL